MQCISIADIIVWGIYFKIDISILCQEDVYVPELIRYIHLNPLRAKIIPDLKFLDKYTYSGHAAIMGKKKNDWQDTDFTSSYNRLFRSCRGNSRFSAKKAARTSNLFSTIANPFQVKASRDYHPQWDSAPDHPRCKRIPPPCSIRTRNCRSC